MAPRPRVTVVGLGPGDPGLLTEAAREAIVGSARRFVRTRRHPSAGAVEPATSFDDIYEAAAVVDDVYPAIVERLVAAAGDGGGVIYAVPGSPLVAERTVELLRADPRIEVDVLPALSFVDLAWARLGVDPFAAGAHLVDGHRFSLEAAGRSGPFLVAQTDRRSVLSDLKLTIDDGPRVTVLSRLGLPDEAVTEVDWADLDRSVDVDHLTCVWIPRLAEPVAAELVRFDDLVRTLRDRCPWDREQTHATLRPFLVEEAYEVLEALDVLAVALAAAPSETSVAAAPSETSVSSAPSETSVSSAPSETSVSSASASAAEEAVDEAYEHLEEELGDLLFQIFFHSVLAAEEGRFTVGDVARGIHDKLVRRHPHVFAPETAPTDAAGVAATWERNKRAEQGRGSLLDGVPPALPGLQAAAKLGRKAGSVGFDWPDADGVRAQVDAELVELAEAVASGQVDRMTDELGDVLFSLAQLGRRLGVEPEGALREANAKFSRRFRAMEATAAARALDLDALDADHWEALWAEAKGAS